MATTKHQAEWCSAVPLELNASTILDGDGTDDKSTERKRVNSLFASMKVWLYFGKIFGYLPISGLFSKMDNVNNIRVRKTFPFGVIPIIVISALVIYNVLNWYAFFVGEFKSSPLGIACNSAVVIFTSTGLYMVIFMYRNAEKLLACVREWEGMQTKFDVWDKHLPKIVNIITGVILISAILENAAFHAEVYFEHQKHLKNGMTNTTLLRAYWQVHFNYNVRQANLIPYHDVLSALFFTSNKFAIYVINYADILIFIVARHFHRRLQLLNKCLLEFAGNAPTGSIEKTTSMWKMFVLEHEKHVGLLTSFADLLSPLIMVSSINNIFIIGFHFSYLMHSSKPDDEMLDGQKVWREIYRTWAVIHMVARAYIAFSSCAKVNRYAHEFLDVLKKCPPAALSKKVERAELKLRTDTIGFNCGNLFTITRCFILKALNVIFTFEIVLLQSPSDHAG